VSVALMQGVVGSVVALSVLVEIPFLTLWHY